jgi:hypothetical protein
MKKLILFISLTLVVSLHSQAQTDVINIIPSGNVGISSIAPVSSLEVAGSYGQKVTTITTNLTLDASHNTVVCNNGSTAIIVTLPTASSCTGRVYIIKRNAASTNTVTIAGAPTIDGAASFVLNSANQVIQVFSDGSEWKATVGGLSGLTALTAGNDIDFGTSSSPNSIDIEPTLNFVHTVTAPASNNLNLNAASGFAAVVNYNNGTTGTTQTFRIGNGASSDIFWVLANGETHGGWFISEGTGRGWRNTSHGGGLYMDNNTHIKTWGAKDLYIVGTGNTLRVDGLATGNTYNSASTAASSNLLYANNSTGDVYALPTATSATLVTNSSGVPSWLASTGTGTQGYWTRSGTTLYNTNQSDNVGIGTTAPYSALDVITPANSLVSVGSSQMGVGSYAGIHFGYREANNLYRKSAMVFERTDGGGGGGNAAGKIHFLNGPATGSGSATLADTRMTIGELGNVGIASTAPVQKLEVNGRAVIHNGGTTYNNAGSGELHVGYNMAAAGTVGEVARLALQPYGHTGGPFVFYNRDDVSSAYLDLRYGGSNLVSVIHSGNVGVGTLIPGARLHVGGSNQALRLDYNGTDNYFGSLRWAGLQLGNNGDNRIVAGRTAAGGNLRFYVNNTNDAADYSVTPNGTLAMTMASNGNVGIASATPGQKLDVAGNIKLDDNMMVEGTSAFRVYRNLVSYAHQTGTSPGIFIIHTNQPFSTDCMFRVKIEGYFYDASAPFETTVAAYNYSSSSTFINLGYTNTGAKNLPVRLARNASGNIAIILGTDGASYSHPHLSVTSYHQSYGGINETYADGWTLTRATDASALTLVTNVPNVTTLPTGSGNYIQNQVAADQSAGFRINGNGLFNGGSVGIGSLTPGHKLDVAGGSIRTTNQLISTVATGTAPLAVTSTTLNTNLNADRLDSYHASELQFQQSNRDFPNGTLIQTNINYAVTSGEPWLLEIEGNSYGNLIPIDLKIQGYIYYDSLISVGGISNGLNITGLSAFNYGGNLCFWFPTQGYWNGYSIFVNDSYAGTKHNRLTTITHEAKPVAITKEVQLTPKIRQSWHSGNFTPSSYAPVSGSGNYIQNQIASAQGANFWVSGYGVFGSSSPLRFTSIGSGTYNQTIVYHDATNGLLIERARTTDAPGGTITDFSINQRGGGTPAMIVKGSGSVGINTTAPATLLNVNLGAGDATVGTAAIRVGGTTNYPSLELGIKGGYDGMISTFGNDLHIYAGNWRTAGATASENHSISFYTSQASSTNWNTAKMILTAAGNLGVGVASPAYKLQVYGPAANYPLMVGSPDGYVQIGPANTGWCHFSTDRPRYYFNVGASFDGGLVGSYDEDLQLQTQGSTRITASNSTGYVGVGDASPLTQLHVSAAAGISTFTGATRGILTLEPTTYTSGNYSNIDFLYSDNSNPCAKIGSQFTGSGSTLTFGTSNNYSTGITNIAMTIDPSARIDMSGYSGAGNSLYVNNSTGSGVAIYANNPNSAAPASGWALYAVGDLGNYGGNYYGPSDRRLKTNINDYTGALNSILKLSPKTFYWDNDKYPNTGADDRLHYGFIAQEVEEIFPTLVKEKKLPNVDSLQLFKTVDYTSLIPVLTKAIQEQQAQIEEGKAERDAQQKQIEKLEQMLFEMKNKK